MTATEVLTHCRSIGVGLVLLGSDRIRLTGPMDAQDRVVELVRSSKPELLALLRAGREAEVRAFYSQAFARLGSLYGSPLVGNLWPTICRELPDLARAIEVAAGAAEWAAVAYQSGNTPDSAGFLAALATWEARWTEAITTDSRTTCSACGRDSVVLVTTTYGSKFCRDCLRPEALRATPKSRGLQ